MKKSKLNLVIETLLLLCITAIAGIGLLMKFVLVPGYRRWEIYERNVELFLWGLDRHHWGTIHLVIAFVFLTLLVFHIVLHWGIIVCIYRKLIPNGLVRSIVTILLISLTIFLLIFSFFVNPNVRQRGLGRGAGQRRHEMPEFQTQRPEKLSLFG